jgi:NitT/TauT family transport system permease protein
MSEARLRDEIPSFEKGHDGGSEVGLSNWSALTAGSGIRTWAEVGAIALVAVIIVGGAELLLRLFEVEQYILPTPSLIATALVTDFPYIYPHVLVTLVELGLGFAIGASIGLVLAAVITQFPFVEKIVTPYILLLVTTPMIALVPLLILRFGFGLEPRIIAVALASGPMVMINAATGTAVGAEMVGGSKGLGNRLSYYSSLIQMPQFFACIVILALLGIGIYVLFFWIGKKWASWES